MTERHPPVRASRLEDVTAWPPADEGVADGCSVGTTNGTSSTGSRRPKGN
ncbi:hypothetical protein SAMN05660359_00643 [Geodermatophilus obscurus]|uniref:Uncharacterized protein n=1 Tax=Geodermatophilus obscurus TaxID=1861 RepID=A0A1I5CY96_9ACTN|nr:hypothetical protein SAMN05660359_00643 [Geodermatophilus obscurus]